MTSDTEDRPISHQNELRDHRHLLASLQHAHARSLQAGLLSALARPAAPISAVAADDDRDRDQADVGGPLKREPAPMDVDSDVDDDPPPMRVLSRPPPPSTSASASLQQLPPPLPKVHSQSNFTLFPVHMSQLPPPPSFSLPDEVIALANAHLRAGDPPSELLRPHAPALVASTMAFLDSALLAVADATSSVGNYSERERARQRAKEREAEPGGWLRVVEAMSTMAVPENVKRRTLARLEGLYGPSPALRYRPPPPDRRPPLATLEDFLGIAPSSPQTAQNKVRGKDRKKRKKRADNPFHAVVKSQPPDSQMPPPQLEAPMPSL